MSTNPKLSVYKAINKSFIACDIKNDTNIRVYYKWNLENRKNPIQIPCIIVDYDQNKREWYINYIGINKEMKSCTVNDITGDTTIKLFDFIN
jgi:hypothetical protein